MTVASTLTLISLALTAMFFVQSTTALGEERFEREDRRAREEEMARAATERGNSLLTKHRLPSALTLTIKKSNGGKAGYDTSYLWTSLRVVAVDFDRVMVDEASGIVVWSGTKRTIGSKMYSSVSSDWQTTVVRNSSLAPQTNAVSGITPDEIGLAVCLQYGRISSDLGCETISQSEAQKLEAGEKLEVDLKSKTGVSATVEVNKVK